MARLVLSEKLDVTKRCQGYVIADTDTTSKNKEMSNNWDSCITEVLPRKTISEYLRRV